MIKIKFTLLWVFTLFMGVSSFAQRGSDPAVTSRDLQPAPLQNVGSPFSMTFTIGNNGAVPISGTSAANRMNFGICLSKCALNGDPSVAITGPLLAYFDISINPVTGCIDGAQKANLAIPATTVFDIYLSAIVTEASSTTTVNNIGASCNIAPNPSANPQPTDNDFASIYTHTNVTELPVSLVSFTAKAQEDQTVLLNWSTSWERANKGYIVERSKDLKSFDQVGQVTDVAGTSNSINAYRFIDNAPLRGRSYYRLRQVDLNGTSQTFEAKSVEINGKYGVYPNPVVSQQFTLDLDEPTTAVLRLYNASGSELSVKQSALEETKAQVSTSSKLSAGVYVLTVEERGNVRKHRIVVQ
ncbi:T9SS type A sorting domain-containing protein [Spirosoma koreense]